MMRYLLFSFSLYPTLSRVGIRVGYVLLRHVPHAPSQRSALCVHRLAEELHLLLDTRPIKPPDKNNWFSLVGLEPTTIAFAVRRCVAAPGQPITIFFSRLHYQSVYKVSFTSKNNIHMHAHPFRSR